jgi:L-lactate dehydrogenase complex protein LldE
MTVDLFIPCFIDQMYPQTGMNVVKVLEKAGCTVNYNMNQTCCGQPAFNAGFWKDSEEVCRKFITEFSSDRYVVCPSASCTGMVKNYYRELLQNTNVYNDYLKLSERVFEFTDFLVNILKVTDVGAELKGKATYHDSCSALRECYIKETPRLLLKNVKGLELVEMKSTDECCGFGGTFAVKFEPVSVSMAEQKVNHAEATDAEFLISTDLSCLMHLEGFIKKKSGTLKTLHIADVLASGWN